ncbi:hypothetical protein CPB86DRAFT_802902 [Serendipita vermifera]|nr:hypothetical protein CPB86DRAFT_802902 [Serendipita vermifera]
MDYPPCGITEVEVWGCAAVPNYKRAPNLDPSMKQHLVRIMGSTTSSKSSMVRVKRLVESAVELVGTAAEMSSMSRDDDMIICPVALNSLCADALFSDTALGSLYKLAEERASTSESDYTHLRENPSEVSVVIPCALLKLYGDVFVELARLALDDKSTGASEDYCSFGNFSDDQDRPHILIGQRLQKIQGTLEQLLLLMAMVRQSLNNRPTQSDTQRPVWVFFWVKSLALEILLKGDTFGRKLKSECKNILKKPINLTISLEQNNLEYEQQTRNEEKYQVLHKIDESG